MSNKTQLQTNNAALDSYIARINAAKDIAASLPEAGGGGGASLEPCIVNVEVGAPNFNDFTVYYTDASLQSATTILDAMAGGTFTAAKGTVFAITPWSGASFDGANITRCFAGSAGAFIVTGSPATITFG